MLTRRGLVASLLAAPAIIRTPGLLMPVRVAVWPEPIETMGFWHDITTTRWSKEEEMMAEWQAAFAEHKAFVDGLQWPLELAPPSRLV